MWGGVLCNFTAGTVRRVVVTSSIAAVVSPSADASPGKVYSEADWNMESSATNGPYLYSKRLAEEAAWAFAKDQAIDVVTINPGFVLGTYCTVFENACLFSRSATSVVPTVGLRRMTASIPCPWSRIRRSHCDCS